ncbi:MAG: choice-of-anchor D domain-containing protein [bacterium]
MKRIITILVALFIVASIAQSAEKRVLLENHTGAWCGWCPRGTYTMDKLEEANPGKIVGVKYHHLYGPQYPQTDGMVCPEGDLMYNFFLGGGYPSGALNRIQWTDQNGNKIINLGTGNWEYCAGQILPTQAEVEVKLTWKFNEATQKISGTITCNVLVDLAYQLAFQVIVCEDSVTGTGSQFDQNNSLSNNADYKDTPYFDLPATIVGFVHNKVARTIIGGVTGDPGDFPATVKAGETYKWNFISDVPTAPAGSPVKMKDVYLVGVVGASQQGYVIPVLNCVESKAGAGGEATLAVEGDPINYMPKGSQATYKFTLDNATATDKTYNLTLVKDAQSPDGWLAQIVGGKKSLSVNKSAKGTVSIDIFPGDKIGNGKYTLVATDAADPTSKLEVQVEVIHTGAERLYIYSPLEDYDGLNTLLPQTSYDKFSSISISKIGADLTKLQTVLGKFTKVKTAIISCGDNFAFSATDIALLQYYHSAGVDILIDGTLGLSQTEIQTYLKGTFGFGWSKAYKTLNNDQEMPIEGVLGEYITTGFTGALTQDIEWPSVFTITDAAKAKKILVYKDTKTNIAGVTSDDNGAKVVALGFAIGNMTDAKEVKLDLLEKSLYWLENEVAALKPSIAVDKTELIFSGTEVNTTAEKTITISNKGTTDLVLEGFNITGTDASAFKFANISFPKTVTIDEDFVTIVKFTPTVEQSYSAVLKIESNDPDQSEFSVDLAGTGIASGVETEAGFICSVSLSPNPVAVSSQLTYTATGTVNAVIRINDAQGKVVAEVYNGLLNAGTYNYTLNTNNLSSGNYFITAQFDGKWETIPFVIVK